MNPNDVYVEESYYQYLRDPNSVSKEWQDYFRSSEFQKNGIAHNGSSVTTAAARSSDSGSVAQAVVPSAPSSSAPTRPVQENKGSIAPKIPVGANDEVIALSGVPLRIAENMAQSLSVPTATSVRSVPVKVLDENRKLMVKFLSKQRKPKVSYTHIIAWAIVRALAKYPQLNDACTVDESGALSRIRRGAVNLGLAVDVQRKDGSRTLVVPSIKNAQALSFAEFIVEYDALISKARTNKLTIDDLSGATVSLTNPGGIGTSMSMPRLMNGQGLIIATGAIQYPAEFQAVMPEVLSTLAVSKTMTLTSTYDHRIIQGAESGEFLQHMQRLLLGEFNFYDQIFASLQMHYEPVSWSVDNRLSPFGSQNELESVDKEAKVIQMINAYRVRGHLMANVNPLGLQAYYYPELQPSYYGFTLWDLDREFDTGGLGGVKRATLRDIIDILRDTYCDELGVEYMHIQSPEKKFWVQNRSELTKSTRVYSSEEKKLIYQKIMQAEAFENYINTKFIGMKRFSVEGGESVLPIVEILFKNASEKHLHGVVLGMAHRGRLNILANLMGKKFEKIFNEFEGVIDESSVQGSGDVKYHLGARGAYQAPGGSSVEIFLVPNPSHLEAANPIVEGTARGWCDEINDRSYTSVLPVLIHGDAAFMGQGVVPETLNLANLRGYKTGGTIHIIINNQVGFTTNPEDSRSTSYASDMAKFLQVPILHVNGDSPEACITAAQFAFEYRNTFNEDVVIDMLCYRKYGHNEGDDPTTTQPLLYKKIKQHLSVRALYRQRIIEEKVVTADEADAIGSAYADRLNQAFDNRGPASSTEGTKVTRSDFSFDPVATAVSETMLREIATAITTVPPSFHIHPKVLDEVTRRAKQMEGDAQSLSWGLTEALALGSLLLEDHPVRLSGQDSGRGTFNHRQAILHDIENQTEYVPLNHIRAGQRSLHVFNSPLSEYAVLGFEYGYSVVRPSGLTVWEAQFGDFANGAQIVFDQFISSAEDKWSQLSNITVLLPHGFDGQGPEHSSARLERFLQLCAEDNMIVCFPSSPAQLFHMLRRQVLAPWRKPLIVMSPKGYLRKVSSPLSQLTQGSFQEWIDDNTVDAKAVTRCILCSGMFSYELEQTRAQRANQTTAVIRCEQLHPFNSDALAKILARYPNASEIVWAQEEPKNMGAWSFVFQRILPLLNAKQKLRYVGRTESASPATGSAKIHAKEQAAILSEAFDPWSA